MHDLPEQNVIPVLSLPTFPQLQATLLLITQHRRGGIRNRRRIVDLYADVLILYVLYMH